MRKKKAPEEFVRAMDCMMPHARMKANDIIRREAPFYSLRDLVALAYLCGIVDAAKLVGELKELRVRGL